MPSRSRSNSFTAAFTQLTKRHAATTVSVPPTPPSPPPPSPPTRQNGNTNSNRRFYINVPQFFRMYPRQRHVYSESMPQLVDDDPALDLDAFVWDSADEKSTIVRSELQVHDLASHIGNKILESFELDIDSLDASSSSSSSSSSGSASSSEHDSESECSDSTVTRSPSYASTSPASTDVQASRAGLTPPWWHYSLRRKVYGAGDEDPSACVARRASAGSVLDDSVCRWPDQDGNRFMF